MASPDFIVCLECETPCYVFEWRDDQVEEALCTTCGNDQDDQFATPEDFEALIQGSVHGRSSYTSE